MSCGVYKRTKEKSGNESFLFNRIGKCLLLRFFSFFLPAPSSSAACPGRAPGDRLKTVLPSPSGAAEQQLHCRSAGEAALRRPLEEQSTIRFLFSSFFLFFEGERATSGFELFAEEALEEKQALVRKRERKKKKERDCSSLSLTLSYDSTLTSRALFDVENFCLLLLLTFFSSFRSLHRKNSMLLRGPFSSSSCVARPAGLPSQASRATAVRAPLAPRAPLVAARPSSSLPFASSRSSKLCAISKPTDAAAAAAPVISIDNGADSSTTVVRVAGSNRPGLLTALTAAFRDLGLDVKKVRRGRKKDKKVLSFLFPPSATPTTSSPSSTLSKPFPLAKKHSSNSLGRGPISRRHH